MELTVALSREYSDKISKFLNHYHPMDDSTLKKLKFYLKSGHLNSEALQLLRPFSGDKLGFYLHEMLKDLNGKILLPKYEAPPPSADYVAKIEALRARLANKEYEQMTKDVSLGNLDFKNKPKSADDETLMNFGQELRKMNKFLIVFINTILTVAGAFAFTYAAVGYALQGDVFAAQMILGCFVATVVLFADLYFIIRSS